MTQNSVLPREMLEVFNRKADSCKDSDFHFQGITAFVIVN